MRWTVGAFGLAAVVAVITTVLGIPFGGAVDSSKVAVTNEGVDGTEDRQTIQDPSTALAPETPATSTPAIGLASWEAGLAERVSWKVRQAREESASLRREMPPPEPDRLAQAIDALVEDPSAEVDELASSLPADRSGYEARLMRLAGQDRGARRHAALRLLRPLGSFRCVPTVTTVFLHDEQTRPAALEPLTRWADANALADLIERSNEPEFRRPLLIALRDRRDAAAFVRYFGFVSDPEIAPLALEVAEQGAERWIERLLPMLRSHDHGRAMVASRLLGSINGPFVTRQLAALTSDRRRRRIAIAGLLTSKGAGARAIVARLERDREFRSVVAAVRGAINAVHVY